MADLRTYTNPLHKPEEEPSPTSTTTKRSPTSDKKKGFTKKLPLLRRTKSSKDVRATLDTVPERGMPRLHELQRQELERLAQNTACPNTSGDSGLAKWSEMLSAEQKQKRQALKNRDRVVSDDVAAASAKWVVGTSSSPTKPATNNNINMRAYFSGSGADSAAAKNADNAARTTTTRTTLDDLALKEASRGRMEALALSPRSCEGSSAAPGSGRLNQRCARAQLAAMPNALNGFAAGPER